MRAADALFARPVTQAVQGSSAGAAADGSDAVASSIAPDRGGRILRALDEPPPPQLVALEAAHAPKRRGRKPGSKNKPKIKPVDIAGDEVTGTIPTRLFAAGISEDPPHLAAPQANMPLVDASRAHARDAQRRLEAIPTVPTPPNGSPSTGSKRFPWVRDRLKPGEAWKRRRLPRICW